MRFLDKSDWKFIALNGILAFVVGVAIIVGLVSWLRTYTQHGVEVEVADVRGLVMAEAEPLLDAQGLHMVVVDSTYSDKVPYSTVVDQDPKPNSHAKNGRAVYVTVNASTKRQIIMPNLQDLSYRQAETTLRGLGLRVDTIYEYVPSVFRDLVLDVKADDKIVAPGDKIAVGTKVKLVVGLGKGTEQVEVPNLIGMTYQEARGLIAAYRLTIGAIHQEEETEEGVKQFVYRQTPNAGTKVLEGDAVTLYMSVDIEKAATGGGESDNNDWF